MRTLVHDLRHARPMHAPARDLDEISNAASYDAKTHCLSKMQQLELVGGESDGGWVVWVTHEARPIGIRVPVGWETPSK